jgi:hypothetical protein
MAVRKSFPCTLRVKRGSPYLANNTRKRQEPRAKRAKTKVNVGRLSRAIFVATKESPQKTMAALKATYGVDLGFFIIPLYSSIDCHRRTRPGRSPNTDGKSSL